MDTLPSSSSPATAVANTSDEGERKRKADDDTLMDDVSNYGKSVVCCPCVKCQCGCHNVADVDELDAVYLDSLPIGYKFNPTDKELIVHYLLKKINNEKLPRNMINEVNVYGNHPKDIAEAGNHPKGAEWYFFTSRTRKYTHGKRPCRKAGAGYWKASGADKDIMDNGAKIGGKKSLVYYEGQQPNGKKTCWMMHEYVLQGYERKRTDLKDMKLDDYVLCKIYTNNNAAPHGRQCQVDNDQQPPLASNDHQDHEQDNNEQASLDSNDRRDENVDQVNNLPTHHVENNLPIHNLHQHMVDGHHAARVISNQNVINPAIFQFENNMMTQTSTHYYDRNVGSVYDIMNPNDVHMTSFRTSSVPLMNHSSPLTRFRQSYSLPNHPYFPPTLRRSPPQPSQIVHGLHGSHGPNGPHESNGSHCPNGPHGHGPNRLHESHGSNGPVGSHGTNGPHRLHGPNGLHEFGPNGPHGSLGPNGLHGSDRFPMYWAGPKAIPPRPQAAFQESNECDELGIFQQLELMMNQDGHDVLFDDKIQFPFDEHEELGGR